MRKLRFMLIPIVMGLVVASSFVTPVKASMTQMNLSTKSLLFFDDISPLNISIGHQITYHPIYSKEQEAGTLAVIGDDGYLHYYAGEHLEIQNYGITAKITLLGNRVWHGTFIAFYISIGSRDNWVAIGITKERSLDGTEKTWIYLDGKQNGKYVLFYWFQSNVVKPGDTLNFTIDKVGNHYYGGIILDKGHFLFPYTWSLDERVRNHLAAMAETICSCNTLEANFREVSHYFNSNYEKQYWTTVTTLVNEPNIYKIIVITPYYNFDTTGGISLHYSGGGGFTKRM